jgi:hypothetical protein
VTYFKIVDGEDPRGLDEDAHGIPTMPLIIMIH